MTLIYLAVWSNGSVYVGQTVNGMKGLAKRYRCYYNQKHYKTYNARVKAVKRPSQLACQIHGMPMLIILEECLNKDAYAREQYWIGFYAGKANSLNKIHNPFYAGEQE